MSRPSRWALLSLLLSCVASAAPVRLEVSEASTKLARTLTFAKPDAARTLTLGKGRLRVATRPAAGGVAEVALWARAAAGGGEALLARLVLPSGGQGQVDLKASEALLGPGLGVLWVRNVTPRPPPRRLTLTAHTLDLELLCGARVEPVSLVLLPDTRAEFAVPQGCAAAGARWTARLRCAARCEGAVEDGTGTALATLSGVPGRLVLEPAAAAPASLSSARLTPGSGQAVSVDGSAVVEEPLRLDMQHPAFAVTYILEPADVRVLDSPQSGHQGKRLSVQVERATEAEAWLTLRTQAGATLLRTRMRVGEPAVLPCEGTEGWCTGAVHLTLKPLRDLSILQGR